LDKVNGVFTKVVDVVTGDPFLFNDRWFYQNSNFVSLWFNGDTWVLDLTGQDGERNTDLIERPADHADIWDPSGCYYPATLIGSSEGCIVPELCSSNSSASSESSKSSISSSSTIDVQGYDICPDATIEYAMGLEGDILVADAEVGDIFYATDTQRLLVYAGNGVFNVYGNDLGIFYGVDKFINIITQSPVPPPGSVFLAVDTEQVLLHIGDNEYAILNTEPLGNYCASGFYGDYEFVNGSYMAVTDPQGNALIYNGKPYYQNENKVTLYHSGIGWAFDITENAEVATDFIEKPEDTLTPEGHYYISGQSSYYGQVTEGLCQEGSSSSSGIALTDAFSGATLSLTPSQHKGYKLNLETGGTVGYSGAEGLFKVSAMSGDILSIDDDGMWGGPFYLSIGDEIILDMNGEFYRIRYSGHGSFILVVEGIKFIVYKVA